MKSARLIQSHLLGLILFDCLIFFVPTFYDSFNLPKLLLLLGGSLVLILLELTQFIFSKKKYVLDKLDILLISYLFINVFSYLFSPVKSVSLWGFYPFEGLNLFFVPTFISIAWIFRQLSKKDKSVVLQYVFYSIIIASFYILYKHSLHVIRPEGFEGHPVAQAGIIALGIVLTFNIDLHYFSLFKGNLIKLLTIILHLVALYILNSSTAWISLGFALIAGIFLKLKKYNKRFNKRLIIILSISFFCFIIGLLFLINKKQFSVYRRSIEIKGIINMLKGEYVIAPSGFKNLVIGHGQNSSGFYYTKYKLPPQNNDKEWQVLLTNFHNHFFEIFFTTGMLTLFIWLLFFLLALRKAWEKKNLSYIMILFYLLSWQMLYLLLPSIYAITWIMLFLISDTVKKPFVAINNKPFKYIVIFFIYLYCFFAFSNGINLLRAEIAFSHNDTETSMILAPYNDFYIKSAINKSLNLLVFCSSRKDTQFPECKRTNLDNKIKNVYENGKKIVSINPYNAENWALLGTIIFKKYLYSNSSDFALRNKSLIAGKKAFELDPTNPVYADDIGLVYYDIQDYKSAEKYWMIAYKLKPDYHPTLNHLRDLNQRLGNTEKRNFFNTLLN